ncbi:MAG: Crp/Fnr family transcriptional regulator [Alphaproteobacteria bacterium]|nr:Crp/Fnr family transcriptional regulator [Alphaproteobacteria bacterium]
MGTVGVRLPETASNHRDAPCIAGERCFDDPRMIAGQLGRLHHRIAAHPVRKGARLIVEDDRCEFLYILVRGWALKYKSAVDGRRQIVDFALPGEVLGFVADRCAPYAVDMLTDGEVVSIPRAIFDGIVASRPDFALHVCGRLEEAETRAYERIASIGYRSARLRVCRLLVEFIERVGRAAPGAGRSDYPLPLRQQHIGDALGLRVETVCRVLVELRRSGIAAVRRGRLFVLNAAALVAESEAAGDDDRQDDVAPRPTTAAPTVQAPRVPAGSASPAYADD